MGEGGIWNYQMHTEKKIHKLIKIIPVTSNIVQRPLGVAISGEICPEMTLMRFIYLIIGIIKCPQ